MAFFDRFKVMVSGGDASSETVEKNALNLIYEGNGFEDAGCFDQALECYEAAIRLVPNMARAHLNRGNVFLARGDAEGALAACAAALVIDPEYAAAHFNMGNAYRSSGAYK